LRFGSVCSGIEAASVAWESLGWKAEWLAEVDVSASSVLAERFGATAPHFPLSPSDPGLSDADVKDRQKAIKAATKIDWGSSITNWGDMTRLPDMVMSGAAEAPDVLCGGTPCQGFSVAGLRGGLSDPRGQLTLKFVELANAIDTIRAERGDQPCIIVWENVPGVLSDRGNAFGHFLAGLAGETVCLEPPRGKWSNAGVVVGPERTVAWVVKDAQYFGLAQRRARVVVVASSRQGFDPGQVLFEFGSLRRDSAPSREKGQGFTHDIAPCLTSSGSGFARSGDRCGQDAVVAHVESAVGTSIGRSHWDDDQNPHPTLNQCHNTGGVGQSNQELFSQRGAYLVHDHVHGLKPYRLLSFGEYADDNIASTMQSRDHKGATDIVVHAFQPRIARNGRGDMGDMVNALQAQSGETGKGDAAPCVAVIHGTQDPLVMSELTFPLGRNSGQENAVIYDEPTIAFASQVSPTLRAGGNRTGGDRPPGTDVDTVDSNVVMRNGATMTVRRLMPVECERLMGFPDGFTDVTVGTKRASDGARYKQLGNSWAVPMFTWVGKQIMAELKRNEIEDLI